MDDFFYTTYPGNHHTKFKICLMIGLYCNRAHYAQIIWIFIKSEVDQTNLKLGIVITWVNSIV